MVVVLASPHLREGSLPAGRTAGGLGVAIARAAVAAGARVELVGTIGDDEAGDAIAVELERAGIGHAALLRDPAVSTPAGDRAAGLALRAADVDLALRYLVDYRVVVEADRSTTEVGEVAASLASFAGAHRIVIGGSDGSGQDVTVLRPGRNDHAAFAVLVGRYAALLDAGVAAGEAFAQATEAVGWSPAPGE